MVLAHATGLHDEYMTIDGVRYPVLRAQQDQSNISAATPVQTSPEAPFPEPLVLGDSSRSSDQRMAAYTLGDWRDGAGVFRYPAGQSSESLFTFAVSDCDTRFERSLVCRRLPTVQGAPGPTGGFGQRYLYVGYAGATELTFAPGQGLYYYTGAGYTQASAAAPLGTVMASTSVARVGRYTFSASNGYVCYTTDGITWGASASPAGAGGVPILLARHDNKLFALCRNTAGNTATLYQSVDAPYNAPAMTWAALTGNIFLDASEALCHMAPWRDRYGARALYVMTSRYLYGYDQDGQAFQEYFDYSRRNLTQAWQGYFYVWERDDNCYVCVDADGIYQLTGTSVDFLGPNIKGGLPPGSHTTLVMLAGNSHFLYAWGYPPTTDSASTGGVWALNTQGGWHRLFRGGAGTGMYGGGWGNGKLYTFVPGVPVYAQPEPDVADIPMNATGTTYRYDTGTAQSHWTAIMDGGLPNIPIQPLYVEVRAIKSSDGRSQGLAANTTLAVYYRSNLNLTPTQLGSTLTSASTFPARLPINGGLGVLLSDIDLRLDLATSSSTATPIITDVILHFVRSAQVRSQYTVALDLREDNPVFKLEGNGLAGVYYGRTARDLKASLRAVSGLSATNNYRAQVVTASYGGGPALGGTGTAPAGGSSSATVLTAALIRVASSEDPLDADGIFRVAIQDLSMPASGT